MGIREVGGLIPPSPPCGSAPAHAQPSPLALPPNLPHQLRCAPTPLLPLLCRLHGPPFLAFALASARSAASMADGSPALGRALHTHTYPVTQPTQRSAARGSAPMLAATRARQRRQPGHGRSAGSRPRPHRGRIECCHLPSEARPAQPGRCARALTCRMQLLCLVPRTTLLCKLTIC